jgi:diguanylate cyclase (GGDEF)-like protein
MLSHKEQAVIDIQTLLLALGLGNISFSILMAVYTGGTARHAGLRLWMWARLVKGSSQLLGWLQAYHPYPWLENVESAGWVAGLALESAAYCAFFELRRQQRVLFPAACVVMLLAVAAHSAGASRDAMIALMAVVVALYAALIGAVLLRQPRPGLWRLQKLIGLNDLVLALTMAAWAWSGIGKGGVDMSTSSPVQVAAFLSGFIMMIINGFGFLLMCKQKDDMQMERLATIDYLTGLLNRRAFFERAESARMLAKRLREPIALMMLDIDHFKQLNDRFGHAGGDQALVVFANTAREMLRDHDIMGRLGGEEFALVLPGTDRDGALHAAERLRVAVKEARLDKSGNDYAMTVSIGVVLVDPGEELTAALARADRALYLAKSSGRNRVEASLPILKCA